MKANKWKGTPLKLNTSQVEAQVHVNVISVYIYILNVVNLY